MRYTEILTEKKKRKRRKPKAPSVRYGYWWGIPGDQSGSADPVGGDGGGE